MNTLCCYLRTIYTVLYYIGCLSYLHASLYSAQSKPCARRGSWSLEAGSLCPHSATDTADWSHSAENKLCSSTNPHSIHRSAEQLLHQVVSLAKMSVMSSSTYSGSCELNNPSSYPLFHSPKSNPINVAGCNLRNCFSLLELSSMIIFPTFLPF